MYLAMDTANLIPGEWGNLRKLTIDIKQISNCRE